jgi:predicted house-cleaning NTP pyrophosphatase (Maf/HAM1 superfamily)
VLEKLAAVSVAVQERNVSRLLVADTIVVLDGDLRKPTDVADAQRAHEDHRSSSHGDHSLRDLQITHLKKLARSVESRVTARRERRKCGTTRPRGRDYKAGVPLRGSAFFVSRIDGSFTNVGLARGRRSPRTGPLARFPLPGR